MIWIKLKNHLKFYRRFKCVTTYRHLKCQMVNDVKIIYILYMSSIRYIPLGHRCHIAQILQLNKLRYEALPFDNIIYSFEGVIDCLQNNFINFFPKKINCEYIFVGTSHP